MVMSMKTPVKIRIDSKTRDAVNDLKRGGESQDDVIRRLIKYWVLEEEDIESGGRILELLDIEEEV